jgi:uncharacterized membrane protein
MIREYYDALARPWLTPYRYPREMNDGPIGPGGATQTGVVIDAHRLEAFSDSVMAVIITIMAFDLKTPITANWHGLEGRLPSLLVYILSFTFVGIYWNNHHHLLRATKQIDGAVMWANLHLLLWLSFIPFATAWVGTKHGHSVPASVYGVVALGAAVAYFILVRTILRANTDDVSIAGAVGTDIKGMISPAVYILGIGLAYVSPYLAYACYSVVALAWFVPDKRFSRST